LKLLEIGNENGGPRYDERYKLIYEAIKQKHPEMNLIACDWGGLPKSAPVEIADEHFYTNPQQMQNLARRYDAYPRTGPKIYLGEYAVTQGCGQGNLIAALSEAAFITGLERNSDIVSLASYAPLLVNANNRAWNPDAIVFDSQRSFGTPSYWVQWMFSTSRGEQVVPTTLETRPIKAPVAPGGVGVGTWRTEATFADVKLNGSPVALTPARGTWTAEGDGGLRQTELADDRRAYGGDRSAPGDYTLTLRARKNRGEEGFLILFRVGGDGDYFWWNLGGWGNTRHNIERAVGGSKETVARDVPGKIEPDRWYDIRVECQGERVRCYLDNAQVHDVTLAPPTAPLHAVVTKDEKNHRLLVKLVNVQEKPADFRLVLKNLGALTGRGEVLTLSGDDPAAENSFEKPLRLSPVKTPLTGARGDFTYRAPAWSVSILRLEMKK
jgi:alpha-L-arabinofuranosidase